MTKEYIKGYIQGVVEMASELSSVSGPGSMTAQLFGLRTLDEELFEAFGGEPEFLELEASEVTLMELFTNCLGDTYDVMNASFRLMRKLRNLFGDDRQVLIPAKNQLLCEAYSGYSGGRGPFYIVEDMFMVVFEKAAVLFVFGSDE